MVNPRLVVTLGKTALEGVLGREIGALYTYLDRKIKYSRGGAFIIPT